MRYYRIVRRAPKAAGRLDDYQFSRLVMLRVYVTQPSNDASCSLFAGCLPTYYHLYANNRTIELSLSLDEEDLKALVKYIVGYGVLNLKCTSIQHKLVLSIVKWCEWAEVEIELKFMLQTLQFRLREVR